MIMGLDVSTSITGITVLDNSGKRVYTGYCDTRKCENFFEKVEKLKNELLDVVVNFCGSDNEPLERIYIEQSLQAFRPGLSSAKTLLTLAGMNKTVSWLIYEMTGVEPEYIGATTARKFCGIKVPKGTKAKPVVLQFVVDTEPGFVVELTKHGNPQPQYYDMADSIIIARAGFSLWKQKASSKS